MSRTISDKIRLIIDANPNKALAQIKRFNAGLRRIAIGAQQVQMALASISFVAGGAFAYVAKEVVSFDDALRKVESKLSRSVTEQQLGAIRKEAERLGETTAYSAVEVAGMMKALAQSGKTADQIVEMAEAMVMFGRASDMGNLEESTELLTKMLDMFGKGAEDAEHFSDVLVYGANNANTNVRELAEGMRMLGPLMSSMETGSFEKSVATLAILANSGETSGRGGRGARSSQLQAVVADAQKVYDQLGIKVQDVNGNLKNQVDLAEEVSKKMKEFKGDFEGINALVKTNGKIGLNAALITASHADEIREMTLRMRSLVDETKVANAILEGGVGGALRRLRSALQGLVLAMGKDLVANLAILSDTLINGVVKPLTELVKQTRNFASKLGLAAVAAGVGSIAAGLTAIATIVVSNIISAFVGLVAITTKLAQATARWALALVTKFPQLAAAAAALTLVFKLFDANFRKSERAIKRMANPLRTLDDALNGIIDSLVMGDWEGAMDVMEKAWNVAVAAMRLEWAKLKDDIKDATGNITGWAGALKESLLGDSAGFAEAGRKAASDLVNMANKNLPMGKRFKKEGGLFSGDAAGFKSNKQYEFPADMAAAIGGQEKANAIFKRLRDEYYDMRDPATQRLAVGAGTMKAEGELEQAEKDLLRVVEEKNAEKMKGVLLSRQEVVAMKEAAAQAAQENYEKLKGTEQAEEAFRKRLEAEAEAREARKKENEAWIADFKYRFNRAVDKNVQKFDTMLGRMKIQAKIVGPGLWNAFFDQARRNTDDFKKRMNEAKDVVKEISFGKLGSFDIGTAQAELNAKLNDTAARQLDAQLRIAKSNDEIREVLKRNGVGLRVGN